MLSGHANLGLGINLWEGAFASARPSECGFTWNVNRNIQILMIHLYRKCKLINFH